MKKLCTAKFLTFWYPFSYIPKLKRVSHWLILRFMLKALCSIIPWILLSVTSHVTARLRKIPGELISKIDLKLMSKLRRFEETYLRIQSFIDQSSSQWRRVNWYPGRAKSLTDYVSVDKHLWWEQPRYGVLKLFGKVIVVLEEVISQRLLNLWQWNVYQMLSTKSK